MTGYVLSRGRFVGEEVSRQGMFCLGDVLLVASDVSWQVMFLASGPFVTGDISLHVMFRRLLEGDVSWEDFVLWTICDKGHFMTGGDLWQGMCCLGYVLWQGTFHDRGWFCDRGRFVTGDFSQQGMILSIGDVLWQGTFSINNYFLSYLHSSAVSWGVEQ